MVNTFSLSLINGSNAISAISALRQAGLSLAEAKDLVTAKSGVASIADHNLENVRKFFVASVISQSASPVPAGSVSGADEAPLDDEATKALATLAKVLSGQNKLDEARVIELIALYAGTPAQVSINLTVADITVSKEEVIHHKFPLLLAAVNAGVNVMLVGPAGSGKTTAAVKVAETLGLPFYGTGALANEYALKGFIDAQGRIVCTEFRKAFEQGGVFLFDEMDGSLPGAVLAFNSALANDWYDFPDANVKRHPDFRPIAGTNTFGTGADRQYVGRNQLDAASLDRWVTLVWDYDMALEASFVGAPRPKDAPLPRSVEPLCEAEVQSTAVKFFDRVLKVRKAVTSLKIRHVVSPRATINGSKLLAAGWTWAEVEDAVIWKGLDADTQTKVQAAIAA
jgi:hypothetical protein